MKKDYRDDFIIERKKMNTISKKIKEQLKNSSKKVDWYTVVATVLITKIADKIEKKLDSFFRRY